jgi:hypothetical protein
MENRGLKRMANAMAEDFLKIYTAAKEVKKYEFQNCYRFCK